MPITKLTLENFKGVGERVEIPLRPITLLFGANSAGKSTILQALLYLRELLERENADADRLMASGTAIDLGGFRQFVHGHDTSRAIRIGVDFSIDDDGLPTYPTPNFFPSRPWGQVVSDKIEDKVEDKVEDEPEPLTAEGISGIKTAFVEVIVEWYPNHQKPYLTGYNVSLNGEPVGKIAANPGFPARLKSINCHHQLFIDQFPELSDEDDQNLNPITGRLEGVIAGTSYIGPAGFSKGEFPIEGGVIPDFGRSLRFSYDPNTEEGVEALAIGLPFVEYLFSQLMVAPGGLLLKELRKIRYIGPFRRVPNRVHARMRSPKEDGWADGSAAWNLLADSALQGVRCNPELLSSVSEHLAREDRLNLGFVLNSSSFYEIPTEGGVLDTLLFSIERLSRSAEDEAADEILTPILKSIRDHPQVSRLKLVDTKTRTELDPSDVGVGVSQVIPIVVGALEMAGGIMAVEQPELHLHPAIQCALGDVFVEAIQENDECTFLLETHSEHLLLRLMKRIRQSTEGVRENDIFKLIPEDLSVIFVETFEGRSVFREMPINERGELIKAWPGGFFEEDFNEMI